MDTLEVSAASAANMKNAAPTALPSPPIAENTCGSEPNISPGPCAMASAPPSAYTAGTTISPASSATAVSNSSICPTARPRSTSFLTYDP